MIDFAPQTTAPDTAADPLAEGRSRRERLDALDDAIARLSAHLAAATHRLLVLIAVFDAEDGWGEQGFRSCAQWLSWRTGLGAGAARERVRVARALVELPAVSEAMRRGELSYSLARAITRVATPDNEAELVATARHVSAAQMERLVRVWRRTERTEAEELAAEATRHFTRELRLTPRADGSWTIRGRLEPEAGAALQKALEAAGEALFRRERDVGEEEDRPPPAARRADAMGLVAEAALGEGLGAEADEAPVTGRADRYQVVVHLPVEALVPEEEEGEEERAGDVSAETSAGDLGHVSAETPRLEGGPALARATARRLACDAGLVGMVRGARGEVLDVGRRTRTVPPALRRALAVRDGGCVFPGCGSRFCEAHHVVPWAEGGATKLDNLALLCRHHHRLVHEGGWGMERAEEGDDAEAGGPAAFRFTRPGGGPLPALPLRPAAPGRPVAALVARQRGLGIDAATATPDWDGLRMDLDLVLQALMPEPPAGARSANGHRGAARPAGSDPGDVSAETRLGDTGDTGGGTGRTAGGARGPASGAASDAGPWLPAGL